jgi:hypothetical protein
VLSVCFFLPTAFFIQNPPWHDYVFHLLSTTIVAANATSPTIGHKCVSDFSAGACFAMIFTTVSVWK